MDKQKLIGLIEQLSLAMVASGLSYLSTHNSDFSPVVAGVVGTASLALLNVVNGLLAKPTPSDPNISVRPAEHIVALAFKEGEEK